MKEKRVAILRIEVCDVCKDPDKSTAKYRLGDMDKIARMTLCEEHSEPLRVLLTASRTRTRAAFKVTDILEVVAQKTAPAPKKRVTKQTRPRS